MSNRQQIVDLEVDLKADLIQHVATYANLDFGSVYFDHWCDVTDDGSSV